jgi:hypothetical protein
MVIDRAYFQKKRNMFRFGFTFLFSVPAQIATVLEICEKGDKTNLIEVADLFLPWLLT